MNCLVWMVGIGLDAGDFTISVYLMSRVIMELNSLEKLLMGSVRVCDK